ncbi:hypothetical protein KIK84_05045 [Curvibacter sp. CHRR-16]|uniref:hypothetical protein n=1 Tax=Curvibacter sp. CHRR-16 TaxID=2835872 RepID=UPI001BDB53A2|nr:hypothetical protein [Curvibacter sp. CHRR-16]MBT0569681.1 hypothetical protein [Curvibacter sp. CHRR-16]
MVLQIAQAGDLFVDDKPAEGINTRTALEASHTIGGYPIFQPGGLWRFSSSNVWISQPSREGGTPVPLGEVVFVLTEGVTWVGELRVRANLQPGNTSYWNSDPCGGSHLVVNKKSSGRDDNCLTLDYLETSKLLQLVVSHSSRGGRYYKVTFVLNPVMLGARDTKPEDWRSTSIEVTPSRAALVKRLTQWGIQLQDATRDVFDTKKPDALNAMPSFRTVINAPQEFVQQKVSTNFLSVLADVQDNKVGFRAVAYSPLEDYKTTWGFAADRKSKEEAEKDALAFCEKNRKSEAPPCTVALSLAP